MNSIENDGSISKEELVKILTEQSERIQKEMKSYLTSTDRFANRMRASIQNKGGNSKKDPTSETLDLLVDSAKINITDN